MTRRRRAGDDGMTLVELLAVIAILGIISFALTESIILGLKTTEGTGARVSNSSAAQSLANSLTADGQSAEEVFSTDSGTCAPPGSEVFLHLRWIDKAITVPPTTAFAGQTTVLTVERGVSYALAPATGAEQDVVRWSCAGDAPTSRIIGHLSHEASVTSPVLVRCDPSPDPDPDNCPTFPNPSPIPNTIVISPDSTLSSDSINDDITIRRRTA